MHRYPSWKIRLVCFSLMISMAVLTACGRSGSDIITPEDPPAAASSGSDQEVSPDAAEEQKRFHDYTNSLFLETMLDNTVSLHYTIADPESFGIPDYPVTLGTESEWSEEEVQNDLDEMAVCLASFDYSLLSDDQKMTWDILQHHIKTEKIAEGLLLYSEPLGPVTGAAAQLPVTMAEYAFYREKDIQDYLTLLSLIPGYFEEIMDFEQQKAQAGLFMTEATLEDNLEICRDFLKNPEKNYLITSFSSRLDQIDWLSDSSKAAYEEQNRAAVTSSVLPAYEALSSSLESMRSYCTPDGGLSRFPEGRKYFAYLMESRIGSGRSSNEMLSLIQTWQQKQFAQMYTLLNAYPELQTSFSSFRFTLTRPETILNFLKDRISDDYPDIPDTSFTVKYVEKDLEDILSPAFYMIPPLDRYLSNTIYINNGSVDGSSLFTTLAHEGYPGHLYQNVYFNSKNPDPLRSVLSCLGYAEGWATYVENEAYAYDPNADQSLLRVMSLDNSIKLSIYAALDICINDMGWEKSQAKSYLEQFFGELDDEVSDEVYHAIAAEPCYYLSYHGGYLEIMELRSIAEATLGDNFNLKEFHRFFLDLGECPFSLAAGRMADWLDAQ